jgi:sulfur relay (sulfurtransferase) complex TusBCD TusD component (DsrE family)
VFTGHSTISHNGKPIKVCITSQTTRGCTIERVEEEVILPARPETVTKVVKFVSRCHEVEPEAVSA